MPWSFIILLFGARKCFNLDKFVRFKLFLEKMGYLIKYNLIFVFFMNANQEMTLFFALQLRYISMSNGVQIISTLFCFLFAIFNIVIIVWIYIITRNLIANKGFDIPKEYQSIYQNLDLTKNYALYFPIAKAIKKLCFSIFVVCLYDQFTALIISLTSLSVIMYLLIRIIEPYETKYRNMFCEITEFLQCCLYGLMFLYQSCRLEATDDTALYIGYITIFIVCLIIVLNFALLLMNLFHGILTYICKFNTLREAIKMGDLISEKIDSIRMKEFTFEKVWKNPANGLWYKKSMFNHQLVTFSEKATQYKITDIEINVNKKKKNQSPKFEKDIGIQDFDESGRKLRENEIYIGIESAPINEGNQSGKTNFENSFNLEFPDSSDKTPKMHKGKRKKESILKNRIFEKG